jgi:alkanesulfonate monooxygenase
VVRETTEEAWRAAEEKLAGWGDQAASWAGNRHFVGVGQQRLLDLQAAGEVLDSCLWTAPGRVGGGGAGTTWLVGSPADVVRALRAYEALGITHFILSDTPYQHEIARIGDQVVAAMRASVAV